MAGPVFCAQELLKHFVRAIRVAWQKMCGRATHEVETRVTSN